MQNLKYIVNLSQAQSTSCLPDLLRGMRNRRRRTTPRPPRTKTRPWQGPRTKTRCLRARNCRPRRSVWKTSRPSTTSNQTLKTTPLQSAVTSTCPKKDRKTRQPKVLKLRNFCGLWKGVRPNTSFNPEDSDQAWVWRWIPLLAIVDVWCFLKKLALYFFDTQCVATRKYGGKLWPLLPTGDR